VSRRLSAEADFAAALAEGEDFAGIQQTGGIESVVDAPHEIEIGVGKKKRHEFGFFHANAVFAGKRAARFHAITNDFGGSLHGAFELPFVTGIIENDGMKISVAGVKNVGDVEAVAVADFADAAKRLRKLGARNDAVENVVAGSEAAKGAKRVFAAFPEKLAFGIIARDANLAGAMRVASFGDGGGLPGNGFGEAFDFEQKNGGAVTRETGVDKIFDDAKRPAIEHFAGGGNNGARGDVDDSFCGVIDRIENGEERLYGFGLGGEPYGNFGDEGESAFGTDEKPGEVVAGSIALRAANTNDFPVGEDEFESRDVICCNPISERVRTAGIFGDVAADSAGFLAGRIGRKVQAVRFGGQREIKIDDTGLDNGALIFRIDGENAVHARKNDHQAASTGERATREAGPGAAADDGHIVLGGKFDDFGDLFCGGGKNNHIGAAFFDRAVVFIEENVLRLEENGGRAQQFFEIAKKASLHSECPSGRIWHYSDIAGTRAT